MFMTPSHEDRWNSLAQAAHDSPVEPGFRRLLAAIDSGWRVDAPVYLRPRWGQSGPRLYHFILRHAEVTTPRLLSVPTGDAVEAFVGSEGLEVIAT